MRWLNGGAIRRCLSVAVTVVGLVALAAPGQAQTLYGSIVGNVTDSTGAVVPGATVTITAEATNLSREAVTDGTGTYRFVNVQPGDYTVRVSLTGFKERVQTGVPVTANNVSRVNLTMEVGELTEVITVESERALLQTDSGDLHAELESEEITEMPLNAYRNYEALINLVPGATPARFQNAVADTPARSLTTNVNGAARNNNNTKIDGTGAVFVWLPHHAVYVAPAETIETVNVSTASFDAEQGMSGGAAVSVQTKSGTNEFHGSGFLFHENEGLRARAWEEDPNSPKPDSKRNIAGGTLGGPIVKEKLFFFAGYEGTFEDTPHTVVASLPPAALRAGDFSGTGTTIYDPLTGDPNTGEGRLPFPGNVIPANRIHPTAAAINALIPNTTSDGFDSNFTTSGIEKLTRHNYDVKLNYHFNPAAQIWAKYSRMDADVSNPARFGEIGGGGISGAAGACDTKVQMATVGFTWTAGSNLVVDGTAGGAWFDQECSGDDQGTNWGTDIFGIPGTNGDGGSLGDIRASGLPRFNLSGFSDLGNPNGWSPLFRNDRTYTASANATLIQGDHEFRFGGNVERLELTHWQPELGNPRGQLDFGGGITALNGGDAPNEFNSYAAFLLGLTSSVSKSVQHELFTGREWQIGFYARDRWQVNPKLTLNLGLRFERYPLMKRETRNLEIYDRSRNVVVLDPQDQPDVKLPSILPRVGFAYRLTDNDVIRAGYGVTVSGTPFSRPLRGFFPQVVAQEFVTPNSFVPFGTFDTGIPEFFGPAEGVAEAEVPTTALMGSARPDEVNRSYIRSWNVTYERKLPGDISLATSYVGTKTKNQMGFIDINPSDAGEGQDGQPLFQDFGRTASFRLFDGHWDADYHSLQVALNKPFSGGLFLKGAYTWSKAINEVDDDGWAGPPNWNSPSQVARNRALAGYDRTHIFQLGFVADLPFGESPILDGWQLSGTFSAFTGTPFGLSSSGASLNARGNSQTPDQIAPAQRLGGIGPDSPFYDPSSFVPITEVRYGNVGRNPLYGPGWWNLDMVLTRNFRVGENVNLQARVEAYNVTNTPHFNNPNGNVNSSGFMTITSTSGNARNRQVRFGVRLSF